MFGHARYVRGEWCGHRLLIIWPDTIVGRDPEVVLCHHLADGSLEVTVDRKARCALTTRSSDTHVARVSRRGHSCRRGAPPGMAEGLGLGG